MIEYWTGALCASLAGHDKGELFVIIGESKEYVSLVNGECRSLDRPKKKKKKHIQIIHDEEERKRKSLIEDGRIRDEEIRSMIRSYKRRSQS
ncbi:MAG: hypothetical protein HFG74_11835 [Hungatella sp.]|jgi:ribosomal protein L14E/L6E/L27E|nr:hypothetical protein [Hungatella sp.]